jgi:hypothetical protein
LGVICVLVSLSWIVYFGEFEAVFGRTKFGSWKRAMIGGQSLVWKEENVSKRQECSAKEGKSDENA